MRYRPASTGTWAIAKFKEPVSYAIVERSDVPPVIRQGQRTRTLKWTSKGGCPQYSCGQSVLDTLLNTYMNVPWVTGGPAQVHLVEESSGTVAIPWPRRMVVSFRLNQDPSCRRTDTLIYTASDTDTPLV